MEKMIKIIMDKGYRGEHINVSISDEIVNRKDIEDFAKEEFEENSKEAKDFIDYELKLMELRDLERCRCIYISLKEFEIRIDLGKERIIYSIKPDQYSNYKIVSKKELIEIIKALPIWSF